MTHRGKLISIVVAALVGLSCHQVMGADGPSRASRELDSLNHASDWLNSPPLRTSDLRGKVVLIDFWTYTCINWRRTLPWLRHWSDTYKDRGLVVIGVHAPEFSFENSLVNVQRAVAAEGVDYPVVTDNNFTIWKAFSNEYWPALYVIDSHGRVRHQQFGEGNYNRVDSLIAKLLTEAGQTPSPSTTPVGQGAEAAPDWKNLRSPETYLGYERAQNLTGSTVIRGRPGTYTAPKTLQLNQWALDGNWTLQREFAAVNQPNGKISFRFHARDLHLVMGPGNSKSGVRFRVTIDGRPPGDSAGLDIDSLGQGTLNQPRMYTLIRQIAPIVDREFVIEFLDPGAEVYSYTFG